MNTALYPKPTRHQGKTITAVEGFSIHDRVHMTTEFHQHKCSRSDHQKKAQSSKVQKTPKVSLLQQKSDVN